jgi:hypothetical protein
VQLLNCWFARLRNELEFAVAALLAPIVLGCADDTVLTDVIKNRRAGLTPMVIEGELLGNVYEAGARTSSVEFYLELSPDAQTQGRLVGINDPVIWIDPAQPGWQIEFWDPGTNENGGCGTLDNYLAGNATARADEIHATGPGQSPTGKERHCVRPGTYAARLWSGGVGATLVKQFLLDYEQIATMPSGSPQAVTNGSETEYIAALDYKPQAGPNSIHDFFLNFDVTAGSWSDSAVLHIQNAGANPFLTTFADTLTPGGFNSEYFRFSVGQSSSNWPYDSRGDQLTRFYWGTNVPLSTPSNYTSSHSGGKLLHVHRYGSEVSSATQVVTGIDLMRPDEAPASAPQFTRTIDVQPAPLGPDACIALENDRTWQNTDQYLTVGCSARGSNVHYRWQFESGGPWTAFSPDTLIDFAGHNSTGAQTVSIEVKNTSTGLSSITTQPLSVQAGQVTLTGNTFVTVKTSYTYTSNQSMHWFERFAPNLAWGVATINASTSFQRIWPAGDYTVALRQQQNASGELRRGRLNITVCTVPGCLLASMIGAQSSNDDWPLFGGGPVMTWSSAGAARATRFYDLLGGHEGETSFRERAGLLFSSGSTVTRLDGGQLGWRLRANNPQWRASEFSVSPPPGSSGFVFGLAIDFDLGRNAADDWSGFDGSRGVLYAVDSDGSAAGLMLRAGTANALASVVQYGAKRFAPTQPADLFRVQRRSGRDLLGVRDDVQFLVSAAPIDRPATYTVVLLKGGSLAELTATADVALTYLR